MVRRLSPVLLCGALLLPLGCQRDKPATQAPPALAQQRGTAYPRRVEFDPDDADRLLVVERDGGLQVWFVRDVERPFVIAQVPGKIVDARFAGGAHGFVVGDRGGVVAFYDAAGKERWRAAEKHRGPVRALAVAADRIVSGGADGMVRLRDLEGRALGQAWNAGGGEILALALSPDARTLVAETADTHLRLWHLRGDAPECAAELSGATPPATAAPRPQPGQGPVACVLRKKADRVAPMLPNLLRLDVQWGWDHSLAFAPNGRWFAAAGLDGTTTRWNREGRPLAVLKGRHRGHHVRAVAVSPRGDTIASAGFDGTLQLWNRDGSPRGRPLIGHVRVVTSVSFDADGVRLASAGLDETVRLWSERGVPLGSLPRHKPR